MNLASSTRASAFACMFLILALTGCGNDAANLEEGTPSPDPSLAHDALAEGSRAAYQAFLDELYAMYAEFDYDYARLLPYASLELATSAVADMRATHDQGLNIDSSPIVAVARLHPGEEDATEVEVCVDSRGGRVFDVESGAEWDATGSQVNGWLLVVTVSGSDVSIEAREPMPVQADVCASLQ